MHCCDRLFALFDFLRICNSSPPSFTTLPTHTTITMSANLQAFQSHSTVNAANVPTLIDSETGERIVLTSAPKKAESTWSGDSLVPFSKDENMEQ